MYLRGSPSDVVPTVAWLDLTAEGWPRQVQPMNQSTDQLALGDDDHQFQQLCVHGDTRFLTGLRQEPPAFPALAM
jgi:hypothetical protein